MKTRRGESMPDRTEGELNLRFLFDLHTYSLEIPLFPSPFSFLFFSLSSSCTVAFFTCESFPRLHVPYVYDPLSLLFLKLSVLCAS